MSTTKRNLSRKSAPMMFLSMFATMNRYLNSVLPNLIVTTRVPYDFMRVLLAATSMMSLKGDWKSRLHLSLGVAARTLTSAPVSTKNEMPSGVRTYNRLEEVETFSTAQMFPAIIFFFGCPFAWATALCCVGAIRVMITTNIVFADRTRSTVCVCPYG